MKSMIDCGYSTFLRRLSTKGEKKEMKKLFEDIKADENGVTSASYQKEERAYEVTKQFLQQFDKEVALSFLQTNTVLRGLVGAFYEKLIEELK